MCPKFSAIIVASPFSVTSRNGEKKVPPALLTSTSMPPNLLTTPSTNTSRASASRTSNRAETRGVRRPGLPGRRWRRCAPNRVHSSAVARPIPRAAPVTTTILSVSRIDDGSTCSTLSAREEEAMMTTEPRIPLPEPGELRADAEQLVAAIAPPGPGAGEDDGGARLPARSPVAVPRLGGRARAQRRAVEPRPRAARAQRRVELQVRVRVGRARRVRASRRAHRGRDHRRRGADRRVRLEPTRNSRSSTPPTSSTSTATSRTRPGPTSRSTTTSPRWSRSSSSSASTRCSRWSPTPRASERISQAPPSASAGVQNEWLLARERRLPFPVARVIGTTTPGSLTSAASSASS